MSASAPAVPKPLLASVFTINLIEFLQNGMLVFAAVPLMGQANASPEEYSLVAALYASVAILSISQMVVLVQKLGWRRYVQWSAALFIAGALVCARSHDVVAFGAGRVLMAAGGGAFMTGARMLINLIAPGPKRIEGIAAFGSALAIGMAAGPGLAALLVTADLGHLMFAVLAACAALAAGLAQHALPADAGPLATPARFGLAGAASLSVASFCLLNGLQRAPFDIYAQPLTTLAWLAVGAAALVLFVRDQARAPVPFLRLRQLARHRYLFGLGVFSLCYLVLGATNAMLPVFVQRCLGVPLAEAGPAQSVGLSGALVAFAVMLFIVRSRPQAKKFYIAAFGALCLFGARLSQLSPAADLWTDVTPPLALFGAFLTLAMATTALHSFREMQHDETVFSNAQQVKNMLSQFGIGLGVAWAGIGLQQRATHHFGVLGERLLAGGAGTGSAQALAQLAQQLGQQSYLLASVDYFWLLMWVGAAGVVLMALQRVFD